MSLAGSYVLESSPGFKEWLDALQQDADTTKQTMSFNKSKLEVKHVGDNVTMTSDLGNNMVSSFTFSTDGKTCQWETAGGRKYDVTIRKKGNSYEGYYDYKGNLGTTVLEATPTHFIQTMTQGAVTGKRMYKRVQ